MTEQRTAWGWGLASIDAAGNTLDVWYPELTLGEAPAETSRPNHNFGAIAHDEADARGVRRMPVFTVSKLDEPIEDAADAYLRLHLLSMRLAKPNTLNLDGIFAKPMRRNQPVAHLMCLRERQRAAARADPQLVCLHVSRSVLTGRRRPECRFPNEENAAGQ